MYSSILFIVTFCVLHCLAATNNSQSNGSNTSYDQRQTGKYNIHVNIKDVSIIAVEADELIGPLGDTGSVYEDYYDYDTSDFTISPLISLLGSIANRTTTTKMPSTTTVLPKPIIAEIGNGTIKPFINMTSQHTNISSINQTIETIPLKQTTELNQFEQNEIPVQVIVEPVLIPKRTTTLAPVPDVPLPIYRIRRPAIEVVNKSQQRQNNTIQLGKIDATRKCANGQFRDRLGRCRTRRSGNHIGGVRRLLDILSLLKPTNN